jgi:hypothetical protein
MPEYRRDAEQTLNKNVEYSVLPKEHPFLNLPPVSYMVRPAFARESLNGHEWKSCYHISGLLLKTFSSSGPAGNPRISDLIRISASLGLHTGQV